MVLDFRDCDHVGILAKSSMGAIVEFTVIECRFLRV